LGDRTHPSDAVHGPTTRTLPGGGGGGTGGTGGEGREGEPEVGKQSSHPERTIEPSDRHSMSVPAAATTPTGPDVPSKRWTPFAVVIESLSYPASVSKLLTVMGTWGAPLIVQTSAFP